MPTRLTSLRPPLLVALFSIVCALALVACGGESDGNSAGGSLSGAGSGATSSGVISAFGSVFVNDHEFDTGTATLIDDDTGQPAAATLEVGMVVDVKAAQHSRAERPVAGELHLHPLARGAVDAADLAAGTLTVMGQMVQLSAATAFSDHRACVTDPAVACTPITGQSGLSVTGTDPAQPGRTVAGSYVSVHGYLYQSGVDAGTVQIVATLVSVSDAPNSAKASGPSYKAEGAVTAVDAVANRLTIGGLTVDLGRATCYRASRDATCASAFTVGMVASAWSARAPAALPVRTLTADVVRARSRTVVETEGAAVELEGRVSNVEAATGRFVVRGITVDASALKSGALPAQDDVVRVLGSVAVGGAEVSATSVTMLQAAATAGQATYGLEGDFTQVASADSARTFQLQLLGQTVLVDAGTRLLDRSQRQAPALNIDSLSSRLGASTSKHLQVAARLDASGQLRALSLSILPASSVAGLSGVVDAAPAPVNGRSASAPTTFSVLGVPVTAAPAAIVTPGRRGAAGTVVLVAVGDRVRIRGAYGGGTLVVSAPASGSAPTAKAIVVDYGTPSGAEHDCF
ncbi:MAG TPA: DUF5666 domain-containing protein [Burkholderiaceae bacterium]|nr:DUF5666 domain-containing protein [Burkholderiaceae bacterium]HNB44845.1 DUF5666 domain-containing protein [Burkholderiaceae bacterium]HNG80306.1 DUF5666 domain-containing protein [Burkholderiaceae bacterium]